MRRASAHLSCLLMAAFAAACGSPDSGASPDAEKTSAEARDAAAVAALVRSEKWSGPSCRWLKQGAWVLAYPQETALYRAAHQAGYIEMKEVGRDNRIGRPEPAWRIALTEAGKAEAVTCQPGSDPDTWGVPVSRRELVSATYAGESPGYTARKVYEVEYRWVPTAVGEKVKRVLTGNMAVQEGTYRARVYLVNSPDAIDPSGWYVDQVGELDGERVR